MSQRKLDGVRERETEGRGVNGKASSIEKGRSGRGVPRKTKPKDRQRVNWSGEDGIPEFL